MIDVSTHLRAAATDQQYAPYKGWAASAQPMESLPFEEYHLLATEALPALRQKLGAKIEEQNLTYIEVSPEDLLDFEKSDLKFRPWLDQHCAQTDKNPNADFMIVVGVKSLESCQRKTLNDPTAADRNKDYLRALIVPLSKKGATQKAQLAQVSNVIDSMENDERTIARKNQLFHPGKTGYRGLKYIWQFEPSEESILAGLPVLAEIKAEREGHMDAHKLTRKLLGIGRSNENALPRIYETCVGRFDRYRDERVAYRDARTAHSNSERLATATDHIEQLSRYIYDIVCEKDGSNRFLDATILSAHTPPSLSEWNNLLRQIGSVSVLTSVENSGIRPSTVSGRSRHHAL